MTPAQRFVKRSFDLSLSVVGLLAVFWIIVPTVLLARLDTGLSGLFRQSRVWLHGRLFNVLKIRTMRNLDTVSTVVTTLNDPRITRYGRFLRQTKLDELPQLINVMLGDMSFVGPRPDVPEYINRLTDDDLIILEVRPGITGPATLKYRDEERLLAAQADPEKYNAQVIFPDKVRINKAYVENYSFMRDLKYIWMTLFGGTP